MRAKRYRHKERMRHIEDLSTHSHPVLKKLPAVCLRAGFIRACFSGSLS